MREVKTVVKSHPILSYFVIAYGISWTGCIVFGGSTFLSGEPFTIQVILLMFMAMIAGPSTAGILMTSVVDGRTGLSDLAARMRRWRVGGRWYAAALLIPAGLFLTALLLLMRFVSPIFAPGFAPIGLAVGLLAGFFEEIGWMGYAYPKMRLSFGVLKAALLLGVLHAIWHIVGDFLGTYGEFRGYWLPYFLAWMVVVLTIQRVLIAWVYLNTRSVLLTQLMHASSTGFQAVLKPGDLTPQNLILLYLVYAMLLLIAAAWIVRRSKRQLILQP